MTTLDEIRIARDKLQFEIRQMLLSFSKQYKVDVTCNVSTLTLGDNTVYDEVQRQAFTQYEVEINVQL